MKTKIHGLQVTARNVHLLGTVGKSVTYHKNGLSLTVDSNKGSFIVTEKELAELIENREINYSIDKNFDFIGCDGSKQRSK